MEKIILLFWVKGMFTVFKIKIGQKNTTGV